MESEIFQEIAEEKGQRAETCEEGLLFPKEEWNSLVLWSPVALDPFENAPEEVREFHHSYCKLWNLYTKNKGR